jgi:hypothetical protein
VRIRVRYLFCHEVGLCCYLVIHVENLLRFTAVLLPFVTCLLILPRNIWYLEHKMYSINIFPFRPDFRKKNKINDVGFWRCHGSKCNEYDLLRCDAVYFGEGSTLQWNVLPPFSGARSKPSKKPVEVGGKIEEFPPKRRIVSERRDGRKHSLKINKF